MIGYSLGLGLGKTDGVETYLMHVNYEPCKSCVTDAPNDYDD